MCTIFITHVHNCVMGATPGVYMCPERPLCALQQGRNAYKGELIYLWQKKISFSRIMAAIRSKRVILLLIDATIVCGGFVLFSCFVLFYLILYVPSQSFSYKGTGLSGLNQY